MTQPNEIGELQPPSFMTDLRRSQDEWARSGNGVVVAGSRTDVHPATGHCTKDTKGTHRAQVDYNSTECP